MESVWLGTDGSVRVLRGDFNQRGGFLQQDAGKNPVEPESVFGAAGIQVVTEFAFNGFPALRQLSGGFLVLAELMARHRKNYLGSGDPRRIVARISQTMSAPLL